MINSLIKKINVYYLIFSAWLSLTLILGRHTFEDVQDRGNIDNVYFRDMSIIDLFAWALITIMIFCIMISIPKLKSGFFFSEARDSKCIREFLIPFVTIIVCYVPYAMSYWPGGVHSDTMDSVEIALGLNPMTTHEPVGYTLLWKIMFAISGKGAENSGQGAFKVFTVFQMLAMAALLSGFVRWLYKKGLKKQYFVFLTIFFAVYPLFPYYSISLWKDTVFGLIVFCYSWFLYCMREHITGKDDISSKYLAGFIILDICVVFFRNNGFYVVLLSSVVAALTVIKNKAVLKKLSVSAICTLVVCFVIQHPVFGVLGYNVDSKIESLSVPLSQTAYIFCTGGNMSEFESDTLGFIMPLDSWKETYDPLVVDYMKFDPSFDREWFSDNVGQFMKTYIGMCLKNPGKAVKGWLLATMGFWDLSKSSPSAYICPESIAWTGIFQGDYLAYYTGIDFRKLSEPRHYLSGALCTWIALFALFFLLGQKRYSDVLPLTPAIAIWLTLMVAAPSAFTFRYVFGVFISTPVFILCILDKGSEKKNED